ncbi:unnamed protein product [Diabrotica balteata]|uniref:Ubiquinol-cytochrome C reductase hinge domain-containing protein n=1 Tax=Diabrotica balteata TaxID=107213 RepID=A0A9N9SPB1_DIABA|nr:unnamed protein product [Diabrotica balteata]
MFFKWFTTFESVKPDEKHESTPTVQENCMKNIGFVSTKEEDTRIETQQNNEFGNIHQNFKNKLSFIMAKLSFPSLKAEDSKINQKCNRKNIAAAIVEDNLKQQEIDQPVVEEEQPVETIQETIQEGNKKCNKKKESVLPEKKSAQTFKEEKIEEEKIEEEKIKEDKFEEETFKENKFEEETVVEEDKGEDPQDILRRQCRETEYCQRLVQIYEACNERVNSRPQTAETCVEELFDLLKAVDKCVTKDLFDKLK